MLRNTKFEALNLKFETSTNSQNPNDPNEKVLNFENLKFGFVSGWSEADATPDIRISDLAKGY